MKVMVPVKRVVDSNVKIRIRADGTGVDTSSAKMSINPFDEIAVEEATRLREAGVATEVVAVSCGAENGQDVLRTAMAIGADRGVMLSTAAELQPLAVARLLAAMVEREQPSLVILGKQAIDDDCNQTGQMLAALLGWPQATFASRITMEGESAVVEREVDGGTETVKLILPAIVTADLRLNEPRFVSLPNLMKSKKKPLDVIDAASLGVDLAPTWVTLKVSEPPTRKPGILLENAAALVSKLRDEARAI